MRDYTIVIEAVGGSSGSETITSPTKESVEAAMKRLHANANVEGGVKKPPILLRIKHTQGSDKLLGLHIQRNETAERSAERGTGVFVLIVNVGNSFREFRYDPLQQSLIRLYVSGTNKGK